VLALREVRLFVAVRFLAGFARALVAATLSYHVFERTRSPLALGLLGLVEFLPVVPVAFVAGVVADTRDRRAVLRAAHLAAGLGAGVLALGRFPPEMEVALVFAVALALAAVAGFAGPAGSAILPSLVPRRLFQNASVLAASLRHLAWILGPIAMGYVRDAFDIHAPYVLAAGFYLASVACLSWLPRLRPEGSDGSASALDWATVREGLRFVWHRQSVLAPMTLDMFAVVFAGATALLPIFADEILEVGPRGYGLLRAAMGVGTFLMTLVLLVRPPFLRPGRALLVSVAIFGVATVVFGLSRWLPLSVAAFVVAGIADQVSMTTRSVLIQLSTPDALRGRVAAVNMVFIGASNELGDAESGFLAALTSATFAVVAGGVACLAVVAMVAARVPSLARDRVHDLSG
jgi:MFS family permease